MPINANYEFGNAERGFYEAQTDKERLVALEEMIRTMPSHKGAEALRANLRTRYKKLKERLEKEKAKSKSRGKHAGIKKGEMQAVLFGFTNSGKSSILKALTNANPKITSYGFATKEPLQGILNYENCHIQVIDLPPIGSEYFDMGMINTPDTILLVAEKTSEIPELKAMLKKARAKQIVVFNKIDLYDANSIRKIEETLKSKKYCFVLVSCKTGEGISELREKIFKSFGKIRVYTKQPSQQEPDSEPIMLLPGTTIGEAAEKIFHGFSKNIKKVRVWGPSSKFSGQHVGLNHILKDRDTLEFCLK